MARYFKLGKKALGGVFFDSITRLKVTSAHSDKNPAVLEKGFSGRLKTAIDNGHIVEVGAASVEVQAPAPEKAKTLTKMNDEELLAYLKDGFEVDAKGEAEFKSLSKKEKINYIRKAEAEAEAED